MGRPRALLRRAGRALLAALGGMFHNEIPGTAASISYFSLFALFPAFLLLVSIADRLLGRTNLHSRVQQNIMALFPGARRFLAANLAEIREPSPALLLSCLVIVLWASTWVFMFIENALNRMWGIPKRRSFLQSRLRSFVLLVSGGMLLLASTGMTGIVSAIQSAANARLPEEFARDQIINWLWSSLLLSIGFVIAILVFIIIYKLVPEGGVLWSEALSGALLAAIFWEIASAVFAILVPAFNYQRIYGRMAAIITLLVWVYTSSVIMLFGASFTAELHRPDSEQQTLFPDHRFSRPASNNDDPDAGKVRAFSRFR